MSNISLEFLEDTIRSIGLNRPWPVALWFIDRYAEYLDVLCEYPSEIERPEHIVRIYDVPVFTFRSQGATAEQLACRPEFCSTPGVWFEMSDGLHVQLNKEETE